MAMPEVQTDAPADVVSAPEARKRITHVIGCGACKERGATSVYELKSN